MKRILITGAGGFIGAHIINQAAESGIFEVWAGVRKSTSLRHITSTDIHYIDLSYDHPQTLEKQLLELGRFDYIVHNMGVTKTMHSSDFERINYCYLRHFVDALIATQLIPDQFIYMSSLGVVGNPYPKSFDMITLQTPPNPTTLYGKSKLKSEEYLKQLPKFPYVILRPTGVYGPHEKDYLLIIKTIKAGLDVGAGYSKQLITFIYVKDLINVIFSIIEKGVTQRTYFVADGDSYTMTQYRKLVCKLLNKRFAIPFYIPLWLLQVICFISQRISLMVGRVTVINDDKYKIMKQRNWLCDISPLQNDLNFTAQYPLEKGLYETLCAEGLIKEKASVEKNQKKTDKKIAHIK